MPPDNHTEIKRLLEENIALTKANNELLHKIHRAGIFGLAIRILWFAILIGIPFILYFYLLEPYLGFLKDFYANLPEGHVFKLMLEAGL